METGEREYTDDFVAVLEALWGEGFLSPGGAAEVARLLEGLDIAGREVLDIGCGLGGVDLVLVRAHGARRVIGIDVEAPLIARARARAEAAGLAERLDYRLVTPGPLPFAEGAFDVVFSKDAMVHIADKPALFAEAIRVLRPGGLFVASDWLRADKPFSPAFEEWLRVTELKFSMATLAETGRALADAGFEVVALSDRHDWYRAEAQEEAERIAGPLRPRLVALVGEAGADHWVARSRLKVAAMAEGDLRPAHLIARKPG